jgi:hypothetical protein
LGALTWLRPVDRDLNVLSVCTFIPGQLRSIHLSSQVLVSKMPEDTTQVELWHGETAANITMLLSAVSGFVEALEHGLTTLTPGIPAAICDAMGEIKLELTADSESSSDPHAG